MYHFLVEQQIRFCSYSRLTDSFDAVLQAVAAEVQKEAEAVTCESEVGEKLFVMDGMELIHALHFNDQSVFDNQISAQSMTVRSALVYDRYSLLLQPLAHAIEGNRQG